LEKVKLAISDTGKNEYSFRKIGFIFDMVIFLLQFYKCKTLKKKKKQTFT